MALSAKAKKTISQLGDAPKFGDIKKVGKDIKLDHELAKELWSQGDYHPRLLATLIFDKKLLTGSDFDNIAADLLDHVEEERNQLGDWLLANQLTKDRKLIALMESWQHNASPVLRRWFWYHQARLRWMGKEPPAGSNEKLLDTLETEMGKEEPGVQWAMNFCAGWIGIFDTSCRARCIKLGEKFALYKDDPVAKNCTPSYLPEFIRIEVEKRA